MEKLGIAAALKNARKKADLTCKEVAVRLGNSEKTVYAWESGYGQPDIGVLFKLCEIYKAPNIDEMLGVVADKNLLASLRQEEKDLINTYRQLTINSKQIITTLAQLELNHIHAVEQGETPIRILQKTKEQYLKVFDQSAAAGYGDYVDDSSFEMVAVPCIPQGTEFGIRISGESMQPKINNGDIVFVKRDACLDVGDIGIFVYDGNAYCKQLAYKDNTYYLHSLNNKYRDIPILSDSIYTVGKVLDTYSESEV